MTMKAVTEKTLIPISLVITILGGVVWFTTLWARSESFATELAEVKAEQKTMRQDTQTMLESFNKTNLEIVKQLGKIEGRLDIKK